MYKELELSDELLAAIIAHKQKTHESYADLAESHFGDRLLGESLRLLLRRYKRRNLDLSIPEPEPKIFASILQVDYADALIIADVHTPYQNTDLLKIAFSLAKAAGIRELDIAGDLHNFNALSSFSSKNEPITSVEVDIRHARELLYAAANTFNYITIVSGNHDDYYVKKKGTTFTSLIQDVVLEHKYLTQFRITDYDYMFRGDNWLIGHLSNYDETAGAIAATLSEKYDKNVLVGHDHLRGHKLGQTDKIGASIGCMLSSDRFWYKERRLNTLKDFQLGFALILDNQLYLFDETGNTSYNGNKRNFNWWKSYFKSKEYLA